MTTATRAKERAAAGRAGAVTGGTRRRVSGKPPADFNGAGGNGKARKNKTARGLGELVLVAPGVIVARHVGGVNPRSEFDEGEIERLAKTMTENAKKQREPVEQPLVVRPDAGGKFELVEGERRWRAAIRAGLAAVPCYVRDLTDGEADQIAINSFTQKVGLKPLEEARYIAGYLKSHPEKTQSDAAQMFGHEQAWIANRLRLLKLPKAWQDLVTSGEITERHAREVLRFVEVPAALEHALERLEEGRKWGELPTVEALREALEFEVHEETRPVTGRIVADSELGKVPVFKPTEAQRKKLKIVDVKVGDETQERATNVRLWEQLQEDHVEKIRATRRAKEEKEAAAAGKGAKAKRAADKPLTAAQQKALAEEERRKKAERAKLFRKRLAALVDDWLRFVIARELRSAKLCNKAFPAIKLMTYMATDENLFPSLPFMQRPDRCDALSRAAGDMAVGSIWATIQRVEDEDAALHLAAHFAAELLWSKDRPGALLSTPLLRDLVADLEIDLDACWRAEKCGPLTARFFELFAKDDLPKLGMRIGIDVSKAKTKAAAVKLLVEEQHHGPLPVELGGKKPAKKKTAARSTKKATKKAPRKVAKKKAATKKAKPARRAK